MCRNRHVVSVLSDDENIFPDAACIQYAARHHSLWMVCGLEQYFLPTCRGICGEVSQEGSPGHHFLPTFHSICVKVSLEVSLRYHFLPTWHGIVEKVCQVIH